MNKEMIIAVTKGILRGFYTGIKIVLVAGIPGYVMLYLNVNPIIACIILSLLTIGGLLEEGVLNE